MSQCIGSHDSRYVKPWWVNPPFGISPWLFPMVNPMLLLSDLTANGISEWDPMALDLCLPSPLWTPVSWALLCAFSSTLFLLSFHFRIPKGFYPSYPAIFTVVLAINDKHTLPIKHFPTGYSLWSLIVFFIQRSFFTPKECTLIHAWECKEGLPLLRGPRESEPMKEKIYCKCIL